MPGRLKSKVSVRAKVAPVPLPPEPRIQRKPKRVTRGIHLAATTGVHGQRLSAPAGKKSRISL